MTLNERERSAKSEISINIGFSLVRSILLFAVIAFAARILPLEVFALLLLLRRNTVTMVNLLQLGISQTVLRYLAYYSHDKRKSAAFTLFSLLFGTAISILIYTSAWVFPYEFSNILGAGTVKDKTIAIWLAILACGMVFHFIGYSSLLAKRHYVWANIFETMNAAGWLGIILIFNGASHSLTYLISLLAIVTLGSALVQILVFLILNKLSRPKEKKWFIEPVKALSGYGVTRGISAFADMSFLTLLPWMMRSNPTEASYIILAFTFLRVIQAAVMPVTQVLAIRYTQRMGKASGKVVRNKTIRPLALLAGCLGLLMMPFYFLLGEWGLKIWLGDASLVQGTLRYLYPVAIGSPFFIIFYSLRNIIEVTWVLPKNLITLTSALALQFAIYQIGLAYKLSLTNAVGLAIIISFVFAGFISLWWVRRDLFSR